MIAPADNATGLTNSPMLNVSVADPDNDSLTVSFYGRATGTPSFGLIGVNAGVASGSSTSKIWPALLPGTAYEWYVSVSDGQATTTGPTWHFTTSTAQLVPRILTQPVGQTVYAGTPVSFSVTAGGAAPLAYQWRQAGVKIAGATSSTYALAAAQTNHAGAYSVVVTNTYGAVTSAVALLLVVPTVPLAQALDTTNLVWTPEGDALWFGQTNVAHDGADAAQSGVLADHQQSRLRTSVTGPGTLAFWWKVSSQSGADVLSFSVGGALQAQVSGEAGWERRQFLVPAGSQMLEWAYAKDASGTNGLDAAWLDQVTFALGGTAPSLGTQPTNRIVLAGTAVDFSVTASGTSPLRYQWRFNGSDLPGATVAVFSLTKAAAENIGAYSVLVSNDYGAVVSSNAMLTVVSVVAWGNNTFGQARVPLSATGAVALAAGAWHSLALRHDGPVAAWGKASDGQCSVPPTVTNAVAIAGGGYHSLAVNADGTVTAWGANFYHQTNVPAGLTNAVAVAAGTWHSLALKSDGTVVAWGDNTAGQCAVPAGLGHVIAIAAGGDHSLALKADGTVVAWGDNTDASGNFVGESVVPPGLGPVSALAAGTYHSLAVTAGGTVAVWGDTVSYTHLTLPTKRIV